MTPTRPSSLIPFLLALSASLAASPARAEKPNEKPIVYDYIHHDPVSFEEARQIYHDRFNVVEVKDRKRYTSPTHELSHFSHARDAAGMIQTGKITYMYVLGMDGRVKAPVIVRSSNPLLNASALKDFGSWTATPARLDGKPVATILDATFTFTKPPNQTRQFGFADEMAVDAKGVTHRASEDPQGFGPWYDDVLKQVPLAYHENDGEGWGVFRVILNLQTGTVSHVLTVKSTGNAKLDQIVLAALPQWRWVPGRWRSIDLPFTFRNQNPSQSFGEHLAPQYSSRPPGITP